MAQRVTPTQRSRCPSPYPPLRPRGYPVFFFFRTAGGWGTWGYSPYSGIPPAARAAAPTRGSAKSDGKRVCEPKARRKNLKFGQAGMGTHPSWKPRSCPPSRRYFCMQRNYWTIGRGAMGWAVDSARLGPWQRVDTDSGSVACFQSHTARTTYAGGTKQLPGGGAPSSSPTPSSRRHLATPTCCRQSRMRGRLSFCLLSVFVFVC